MARPFPSPAAGDVWGQSLIDAINDLVAASSTKTAYVNFPPMWDRAPTTASGFLTRGTQFLCSTGGTVSKLRIKHNSTNTRTYTLGIYEVSATDRVTVTAVAGQVSYVEAAASTTKSVELDCSIPLVAGKHYVIAATSSAVDLLPFYANESQAFFSPVSATVYQSAMDPGRYSTVLPVVGTVFGKGSDYFTLGMTVAY